MDTNQKKKKLEQALRANLARRKEQTRSRATPEKPKEKK